MNKLTILLKILSIPKNLQKALRLIYLSLNFQISVKLNPSTDQGLI